MIAKINGNEQVSQFCDNKDEKIDHSAFQVERMELEVKLLNS